jgi:hypothetical protein
MSCRTGVYCRASCLAFIRCLNRKWLIDPHFLPHLAVLSRLQVCLDEKNVSLLDELAELAGRFNGVHLLESFVDWAPKMQETLRRLQIGQLHLACVCLNSADVGVALLMQCPAVLGDLSDELRTDIDLATRSLERLALAGNGVIRVFWLYASSWKFVVVS